MEPKPEAEQPFERDEEVFSPVSRSVIFKEPHGAFLAAFYLVFLSVCALGLWSYLSKVNISYFLNGEIVALDPNVTATVSEDFILENSTLFSGKNVKKGEALISYRAPNGAVRQVLSPADGIVVSVASLQRGVRYRAATEVANIRPSGFRTGVKLSVEREALARLEKGQPVVFKFPAAFREDRTKLEGQLISEVVKEGENYVAMAEFSPETLEHFRVKNVRLPPGYPLTAELILGRKRVIERFFGF